MRQTGNRASNAIWNPNEALHPPPTSLGADERDSEVEKFIRRKYEQGAFKADASKKPMAAPTSLNRARELDGRLPTGSVTSLGATVPARNGSFENRHNPELNDILAKKPVFATDRDLPALPVSATAAPRPRPARSNSSTPAPITSSNTNNPFPSAAQHFAGGTTTGQNGSNGMLVNTQGGISSTMPLQMHTSQFASNNPYNPFGQQQQQQQHHQQQQQHHPQQQQSSYQQAYHQQPQYLNTGSIPSSSMFSTSPNTSSSMQSYNPGYGMSTSAPNTNTSMLASFDPLHPSSQQQQQQQQQQQMDQQQQSQSQFQQGSYGSNGLQMAQTPNHSFQQFSSSAGGYMSSSYNPQQQYMGQQMGQQQQTGMGAGQSYGTQWAGGMGNGNYLNGMR